MADGDNIVLGVPNQSDALTLLDRFGNTTNTVLMVRNLNGHAVEAQGTGTGAIGVLAESTRGTGVIGRSGGPSPGIRAESNRGAGIEAQSNLGVGINVVARGGVGVEVDAATVGVNAVSRGDVGVGLRGIATRGVQGFGTTTGVFGQVNNLGGGPRSAFVGVHGDSNSSHGVFGRSSAPVIPNAVVGAVTGVSNQNGVVGESTGGLSGLFGRSNGPGGIGVLGIARSGFAGAFSGDVFVRGNVTVTGGKSAALRDAEGKYRILYAVESPESWFEDFGFGNLVRGRAHVDIAKDYAKFIHPRDYHVFLSPEGESKGLYVTKKSAAGFDVVEQDGGRSGIRFSYRIVAKRRDLRGRRLEVLEPPKIDEDFSGRIVPPAVPRSPEKARKKARRGKG